MAIPELGVFLLSEKVAKSRMKKGLLSKYSENFRAKKAAAWIQKHREKSNKKRTRCCQITQNARKCAQKRMCLSKHLRYPKKPAACLEILESLKKNLCIRQQIRRWILNCYKKLHKKGVGQNNTPLNRAKSHAKKRRYLTEQRL